MQDQYETRTITAFFDSKADAEKAIQSLADIGTSYDAIQMIEGNDPTAASTSTTKEDKGFVDSIKGMFMPDDDRHFYAEGLRRGGYLVSVQADSSEAQRVIDILDNDGSVNMDERAESWRAEGWSSATATTAASVSNKSAAVGEGDGTIEVVEEELRVGKRDVSHGSVRVRAYTVENQVSEDVTLRTEKVSVVRRPVDRIIDNADAMFADKTLEVEERSEEAVVSKEARIVEEIDVAKTVENATERVSGTVRHTEVEVEDDRISKTRSVE